MRMRASALIPRIYRFSFGRDLVKDMSRLEAAFKKATSLPDGASDIERREAQLEAVDLEIFENVAWTMCKAADPSIPDKPDDWLDTIEGVFSIYEIMPQILELWAEGLSTTSKPVKK